MRKFSLVMLVAALALPVASFAKSPPPHKAKSALQQLIAKNSAKFCKALNTANPTLFKTGFGTNVNHRNAYGKCVSAHARAKHLTRTFTLKNITLTGAGTVTNAGAAGCQLSASGCTLAASGTISGFLGGTFTSTFTVMWTQATGTPITGFCAPATGTVTVTLPGLGSLTKTETGKLCEVGPTGANVPHTFTGTFTVSSGTGVFANATGTGTATFTQQPGTVNAQGGAVSGSETFDSLTIHF